MLCLFDCVVFILTPTVGWRSIFNFTTGVDNILSYLDIKKCTRVNCEKFPRHPSCPTLSLPRRQWPQSQFFIMYPSGVSLCRSKPVPMLVLIFHLLFTQTVAYGTHCSKACFFHPTMSESLLNLQSFIWHSFISTRLVTFVYKVSMSSMSLSNLLIENVWIPEARLRSPAPGWWPASHQHRCVQCSASYWNN